MIPLRLSLRELQVRPLRTLLTLFSVMIGVAAIVAIAMTADASRKAQRALAKAVSGNASLEVRAEGGGLFDEAEWETVKTFPGVEASSPSIRRYSVLLMPENKKARVQVMGIDPIADKPFRSYEVVEGRNYREEDEVVMDKSFARSLSLSVDSEIRFLTASGIKNAKIAGLTKPAGASAVSQGSVVTTSLATAQTWFRSRAKIDTIQIATAEKVDLKSIQQKIGEVLPQGLIVRPPAMASHSADEIMVGPKQGTAMAIAFVFIIAVFIIYNTFQMNVGERRRQLGVLRALGATRDELVSMVLKEGMILGAVGIVLGWGFGVLGAYFLCAAMEQLMGVDLPRFNISWIALGISAAAGALVIFLGAYLPAKSAGKMPPSEAMRVISASEFEPPSWRLALLGFAVALLGFGVLAASAMGYLPIIVSNTSAIIGLLGCLLILPLVLNPVTKGLLAVFGNQLGLIGTMARRQLLRHRGRSSLTIGVLFMATCTGMAMSNTLLDNIQNIKDWYHRAIVGDFFIRAAMPDMATGQSADMPADIGEQLKSIEGIERFDSLRFVSARSGEIAIIVVVRDYVDDSQVYFDLVQGKEDQVVEQLRKGGVVVSSVLALRGGFKLGDAFPMETKQGTIDFPIVGICNDYVGGGLTLYINRGEAQKHLAVEGADAFVIQAQKGKSEQVETELRSLCDRNQLMLQSYRELVDYIQSVTSGVVASLWLVLFMGSLIAAFGVINTLAMSIQEQTREIGMLRVVAMTRNQIRSMILAQAMLMAAIAILPGIPAGLLISYLVNLCTVPITGHFIAFVWRPEIAFGTAILGFVVVLLAAMIPAEWAVRLRLSDALKYE